MHPLAPSMADNTFRSPGTVRGARAKTLRPAGAGSADGSQELLRPN
jgi:hypothetical protein